MSEPHGRKLGGNLVAREYEILEEFHCGDAQGAEHFSRLLPQPVAHGPVKDPEGTPDPQVLFMAVGDADNDRAPLQVGQFESAERQMDQWLTWRFLEGGGGPAGTESYELAMYFAARHTDLDCWRKRKHRGYFFMTGDERPYGYVSRAQVSLLMGDTLEKGNASPCPVLVRS